jgi:Lipoprotein LpqB beta-propeller domain/Sporulation and spore germination
MKRLCLIVVACMALAACSSVPTSGPIEQGPAIAVAGQDQFIRVIARPPVPGMSQEDLVRGFQEASASADGAYAVARQYLTGKAAALWDPGSGVAVYDNGGLTYAAKGSAVEVQGNLLGSIDATGQYTVANPGTKLDDVYEVTKVDGEWRLSSVPAGLVLGPGDIDRGFRAFDLYYFTRDFGALVPAAITIPVSGAGMATQLVRALLAGPTSWIAPSVRTGFPEGTRLALDSVPVVDGVAQVALSSEVLQADDATRKALSAQLAWTLRQVPSIGSFRITVGGQPVAVPGQSAVQSVSSWNGYDPDQAGKGAIAVNDRGLVSVTADDKLEALGQAKPPIVSPAVDFGATQIAGLSLDRRTLWTAKYGGAQRAVKRYAGAELSRPSWDSAGEIWVVDRGNGLVLIKSGVAGRIAVSGLPAGVRDADLLAVSMSRDGTRAGLLIRRGTRVEPMVARVERSADAIRVSDPIRIESVLTDAIDLAWSDSGTLAVLGTTGAASLQVAYIAVGTARVSSVSVPDGAVSIATAPSMSTLIGAGGSLYRSVGNTWTSVGTAIDPAYPG